METTETTVPVLTAEEQQRNIDNVLNSVKYSGFNESMNTSIREAIRSGVPQHTEKYRPDFTDNAEATLHFRRSDKGFYFFNKFDVVVDQEGKSVKRSFYVNKADKLEVIGKDGQKQDEFVNTNVSLKEAFNLLEGRAVLKDITKKNKETDQLEKYQAWVMMDFKNTDKQGNYKMLKRPAYNLEAKMRQFNIRDMDIVPRRKQLMTSLERGNLQSVAVIVGGRTETYKFAANPDYNSVSIYDKDNMPVKHARLKYKPENEVVEAGLSAAQVQDIGDSVPSVQSVAESAGTASVAMEMAVGNAPDKVEASLNVNKSVNPPGAETNTPTQGQDHAGNAQVKAEHKVMAEGADAETKARRSRTRIPRKSR